MASNLVTVELLRASLSLAPLVIEDATAAAATYTMMPGFTDGDDESQDTFGGSRWIDGQTPATSVYLNPVMLMTVRVAGTDAGSLEAAIAALRRAVGQRRYQVRLTRPGLPSTLYTAFRGRSARAWDPDRMRGNKDIVTCQIKRLPWR